MKGEWEETTLADVSTDVAYGYTESASEEKVGPRFLRITDIQNGVVDWNNVPYCPISESDHQKYRLDPGDIVVARTGNSTGENYLYRSGEDSVFASYLIRFRVNQDDADPAFVWYNMRTQRWQDFINSSKTGSAQAGANAKVLGLFPLKLPPLPTQRAIAKILGDLDDKIELNRKMNTTLEAMARALFQSWFVDFDPVRAKACPESAEGMDGREPEGMDKETAALWPSEFEDSAIGLIPREWQLVELGLIADVIDCLHAKKPVRCDAGELYLQLNNIREDGLIDISDSFFVSKEDYRKWISRMEARAGDCLITNVGRVGAVGQIPEGVKAALGRNITGIRCKSSFPFPTFLIECLVSDYMREEIRLKTDSGTILDALNVKSIPKLRFVQPTLEIAAIFDSLTRPLRRRMEQNLLESRTLATLRDTLLPKLMSGEVRVNELDAALP